MTPEERIAGLEKTAFDLMAFNDELSKERDVAEERIAELEAAYAALEKSVAESYAEGYAQGLVMGMQRERAKHEQGDGDGGGASAALQGTLPLLETDGEGLQLPFESADS